MPRDPRRGVLHPLIASTLPDLRIQLEEAEQKLPAFVDKAFEQYLLCGLPEAGFILLECEKCRCQRALPFSCKTRSLCPSCNARRAEDLTTHLMERVLPDVAVRQYVLSPPSELVALLAARGEVLSAFVQCFVSSIFRGIRSRLAGRHDTKLISGAIIFIQRFTKSLTVFPHAHVLVLDGAYGWAGGDDEPVFFDDGGSTSEKKIALEEEVPLRFERWLKRHGYVGEVEAKEEDEWFMAAAREPSGWLRDVERDRRPRGFDVHVGRRIESQDRQAREQLVRYLARPPFAEDQIELIDDDRVRITFRTPARSGQSSIELDRLSLVRRLSWLVRSPGRGECRERPGWPERPPSMQHQIRYAGALAPASKIRPLVTPAGRVSMQGVWFEQRAWEPPTRVPYRVHWAALLKRTYDVDAQSCPACGGRLRPVRAIEPPLSASLVEQGRIEVLKPTGPPDPQRVLALTA